MSFSIGVLADSFRLPWKQSLQAAKDCGAQGVQLYATNGELAPENLNNSLRRELRDTAAGLGLTISAICGDLGGHGFAISEDNPAKIAKSQEIVDLAVDLGCNVVTTHIGVVPDNPAHPRYGVLQDACGKLAEYAVSKGVSFAIETGPERAETLRDFLDSLPCKGMAVNLDPANLVMVTGDDPVQAVYTLRDHIVHTHAKDGIMLRRSDPEEVYRVFAEGGIEGLLLTDYFLETPLGEGKVDFPAYLKALRDIGYNGFLTIEREAGEHPSADIRAAVRFLQDVVSTMA